MTDHKHGDIPLTVVVVGGGIGGLCAAARLSAGGCQVTAIERLRKLGGRFSTREVEGFKLPTGAFMIATDDPLAWTFRDLGIPFPVREATERPSYLIEGELVDIGERGGLRTILSAAAVHDGSDVDQLMAAIRGALASAETLSHLSLPTWLTQAGAGDSVQAVIESNTRAYLGVNASEVTAQAFFDYLRLTAGGARYGVPPAGGISIAHALADFVTEHGGQVLTDVAISDMIVDGQEVVGVRTRDGVEYRADLVVSNVGLENTAKMLPEALRDHLPPLPIQRNAPGVTSFIASERPFFDRLSVTVVGSRGVCIITTPTLLAPELAPPGWHFTESLSTFESSTDQDDPKAELERHRADLDELLPNWEQRGRLLQTSTYRGVWPVARTWLGHDPDNRFPLPGLALVGDSIKEPGWTGVGASAGGARLLAEAVLDA